MPRPASFTASIFPHLTADMNTGMDISGDRMPVTRCACGTSGKCGRACYARPAHIPARGTGSERAKPVVLERLLDLLLPRWRANSASPVIL
jgi:hypothetical protein